MLCNVHNHFRLTHELGPEVMSGLVRAGGAACRFSPLVMRFALLFLMLVCFSAPVWPDMPEYSVKRATEPVVIDGILDEADWTAAQSVGNFAFPWWKEGEKEQTEVKMLWDNTFLYVSYQCSDTHLWAEHYDTNSATCLDDCVELFWNPSPGAGNRYNMFEINCIGNLLSVYYDADKNSDIENRDSRIMVPHIAQTIRGTVNNDADTDSGWIIEMAVRFSDYPKLLNKTAPAVGDSWRVGLNRCGGKINEQFSQWSPSHTPAPNFHAPQDFGTIVFSAKPVR